LKTLKLPNDSPFFAQRMDDLEVIRKKLLKLAEEKKKKRKLSKDPSLLDERIRDRINKRRLESEGKSKE